MNSHQICSHGHFQVFGHLQTVTVLSTPWQKVFLQKWLIFREICRKNSDRFLVDKINLPSCGRDNNKPFQNPPPPPKAICTVQPCALEQNGGPIPVLFPTSVKQAHYMDDTRWTCEDLTLWQDTLPALLEHVWEDGQQIHGKFKTQILQ